MIPMVRDLSRLHDTFLYLTILLAFAAVVTGGGVGAWMVLLFPVSLIGAHLFYRAGLAKPHHIKWWNALILLVLLASFVEYIVSLRVEPMDIGVRFVLILILIKLFSRQGARDEIQLHALSFLTLAAASTFNEELSYGVFFGLYVLTGTFGLALFHLKTEASQHAGLASPRSSPFDRLYVGTLAMISLAIFVSSLVIFFAFPRIGLGLFMEQSRQSLSVVGFSDAVSVGDHGAVRDNPAVVMRVDFHGEPPPGLDSFRWRTMSFDEYEGGGWSRTRTASATPAPYSRRRSYDLDVLHTEPMQELLDDADTYTMEIYLEPLGTNVLPAPWPAAQIDLATGDLSRLLRGNPPGLAIDTYGDLHTTRTIESGHVYELTIYASPPTEELRRPGSHALSPSDRDRYLQLPDLDPRVAELANTLTADAASNYEKAEAIGSHFFTDFQYTLDLPPVDGEPVEAFLFDTRRGHCEYFATAAAVLLRTQGVPTRVVNGFLGGSWNDLGGYFTVRQGDAHAWIEVYVPELGWVPYDPTPPITSSFLERAGILPWMRDASDAMRQAWLRWVLEYDLDAQARLLRDLARSVSPAADSGRQEETTDESDQRRGLPLRMSIFLGGWGFLLLLGFSRGRRWPYTFRPTVTLYATSLTLAGGAWTGLFQAWSPLWIVAGAGSVALATALPPLFRGPQTDPGLATQLFTTIATTAARHDHPRQPDEGPGDYLERLARSVPDDGAQHLHHFRRLYLKARFAPTTMTPAQRRALESAAARARQALRSARS